MARKKSAEIRELGRLVKIKNLVNTYSYGVTYSNKDKCHIAVCHELGGMSAHGSTPEKALREVKVATAFALECLIEDGLPLPEALSTKTFSGRFNIRINPDKHRELAREALEKGVSMNSLIANRL